MVDNLSNPSIFVISKDCQVYPEFVVTFRDVEKIEEELRRKEEEAREKEEERRILSQMWPAFQALHFHLFQLAVEINRSKG